MSELLEKYSWGSNGRTRIAGTEDWVEVACLSDSGGDAYSWSDFNVFYSPSARLFFWHGDSGCSCNAWDDGIGSAADFENGDREAVVRAWKRFVEDYYLKEPDRASGVAEIRAFEA